MLLAFCPLTLDPVIPIHIPLHFRQLFILYFLHSTVPQWPWQELLLPFLTCLASICILGIHFSIWHIEFSLFPVWSPDRKANSSLPCMSYWYLYFQNFQSVGLFFLFILYFPSISFTSFFPLILIPHTVCFHIWPPQQALVPPAFPLAPLLSLSSYLSSSSHS